MLTEDQVGFSCWIKSAWYYCFSRAFQLAPFPINMKANEWHWNNSLGTLEVFNLYNDQTFNETSTTIATEMSQWLKGQSGNIPYRQSQCWINPTSYRFFHLGNIPTGWRICYQPGSRRRRRSKYKLLGCIRPRISCPQDCTGYWTRGSECRERSAL